MAALGAWHGVNPAMGWLFAVALGLQEGRGRAVWRALPPLALGHALAVGQAVLVGVLLGTMMPVQLLKWLVAALLLGFGVFKLVSSRHPRFGGMQVGAVGLTVWSMLMASAHGAGLMVVPFVIGDDAVATHGDMATAGMSAHPVGFTATLIHTGAYLLVAGCVALVVYHKLGLRLLRSAWI
ncbi:MAG: hypothetical protein PVH40_06515, partial [Gemmatimonadales bacterium]